MDTSIIYYGIFFLSILIVTGAQLFIKLSYNKYSKVKNSAGKSGAEVAREILEKNGLSNVYVVETSGTLTDHYDPSRKVVRLSSDNYNGKSIAAVSVAAHECGHAIQDKENYTFLRLRASLVPIVNFASNGGQIAIALGFVLGILDLIWLGIIAETVILVFHLVTLPVEFNASSRALKNIEKEHILNNSEYAKGRQVLFAAALTYVASVLSVLLTIFNYVIVARNRD